MSRSYYKVASLTSIEERGRKSINITASWPLEHFRIFVWLRANGCAPTLFGNLDYNQSIK